jgi:glucosamine-6-phosphate deaminase
MARPISKVAPGWWDYTTLDPHILADAAKLTADDLLQLSRDGFEVTFYDRQRAGCGSKARALLGNGRMD